MSSDATPPGSDAERRRRIERFAELVESVESPPADDAPPDRSPRPESSVEPHAGLRIGSCVLKSRLGAGAMGVVWLADDESLARRVAIKFLPPHLTVDPEAVRRFGREATAAGRLDHRGIVSVHAAGDRAGLRFLVMDFVDGAALDEVLGILVGRRRPEAATTEDLRDAVAAARAARSGRQAAPTDFPPLRETSYERCVATWGAEIADALDHAHRRGVLHRDVKPSNVLVDPDGHMKLADFGLARIDETASLTRTGTTLGTLAYMAPETLEGHAELVDARADVYSLGVLLYEMLTFRLPFEAASISGTIDAIRRSEPARLRSVQPRSARDLESIVSHCLAKDRARRYATAGDLASDLRRFLAGEPVRARTPGAMRHVAAWARQHPARASLVAAGLVVAIAAYPAVQSVLAAHDRGEAADLLRLAAADVERVHQIDGESEAARAELADVRQRPEKNVALRGSMYADSRRIEAKLRELSSERDSRIEAALAELERAKTIEERRGGASAPTRRALAEYHAFRLEDSLARGDATAAAAHASQAMKWDDERLLSDRLAGTGTATVSVEPSDAELFLFRYEDFAATRNQPFREPRLVPVPVTSAGVRFHLSGWIDGFDVGDPCLAVQSVLADSPAARAGIGPDDLLVKIGGESCGEGIFVRRVVAGGEAARAGMRTFAKIIEIDARAVLGRHEWDNVSIGSSTMTYEVVSNGLQVRVGRGKPLGEALGVEVAPPAEIVAAAAPQGGVHLTFLHRGVPRELELKAGESAGVTCVSTSCPLVLDPDVRITASSRLTLPAGSYVLLATAAGWETARFPFVVRRGGSVDVQCKLLRDGTTPPDFVRVPKGPCLLGGEDSAFAEFERERAIATKVVSEFSISRTEVTGREWDEFVNARVGVDVPDLAAVQIDGADVPIRRVSGRLAEAYALWRNEQSEAAGRPWRLALPTLQQLEKAARGADGRRYPWGDRFDKALCINQEYRDPQRDDFAAGTEVRDESPYGVRDLAGSRREWIKEGGRYFVGGGDSADSDIRMFRASYVDERSGDVPVSMAGVRLVAVPIGR